MPGAKNLWGALALVLVAGGAGAAEEWETISDEAIVIKVRARPDGKGKEIRAEGEVEASAADIQAALTDPASFKEWMPYTKESRLVSTGEDGSRVTYTRLDFPVVSDRDYVAHVVDEKRVEDGAGEYMQRWKLVEGVLPERVGIVRLKYNEGSWHVTAKGEGKSHVVYRFSVDPGGWVPSGLASIGQKDGVLDTLEAVRKRARKLAQEREKAGPAPSATGAP